MMSSRCMACDRKLTDKDVEANPLESLCKRCLAPIQTELSYVNDRKLDKDLEEFEPTEEDWFQMQDSDEQWLKEQGGLDEDE